MIRAMLAAIFATCVSGNFAHGADAPAHLQFEVASARRAAPDAHLERRGGPGTADPGRIFYSRVTLLELLTVAYGVRGDQVSGPDWLQTERYTINAKIPPNTTKDQFNLMLQDLLAERFHLTLHHAAKEFPAYELVVASGGHKMQPSPPDVPATAAAPGDAALAALKTMAKTGFPSLQPGSPGSVFLGGGMVRSTNSVTMAEFAATLGAMVNISNGGIGGLGSTVPRVVDKTGLNGKFTFTLEFAGSVQLPASLRMGEQPAEASPTSNPGSAGPSLLTALKQQLGLKLEKKKPVILDLLVVEHVDKVPTEN
jgi:uncharacterized protein (TIGR03435 family)